MSEATQVAFAARENAKDLTGATVAIGDGETYDVAAALEAGNGTIVVDADSDEDRALAGHPALKRTNVPEAKASSGGKSGSSKEN